MKSKIFPSTGLRVLVLCALVLAFFFPTLLFSQDESNVEFEKDLVYVIPIEGVIDQVQAAFIDRVITEAIEKKAKLVLIEMHTWGGRVDSAQAINKSINSLEEHNIRSSVYVMQNAISAGAMISLACKDIYLGKSATIGDSQPVIGGVPSSEEKYLSMIRAE